MFSGHKLLQSLETASQRTQSMGISRWCRDYLPGGLSINYNKMDSVLLSKAASSMALRVKGTQEQEALLTGREGNGKFP